MASKMADQHALFRILNYDSFGALCFVVVLLINVTSCQDSSVTVINQLNNIDYGQCVTKCSQWSTCKSAKYYRTVHVCKMYAHLDGSQERGAARYVKPQRLIQDQQGTPHNPDSNCEEPMPLSAAMILGNMRSNGSKIKYVCTTNSARSAVSVCISGQWTDVTLECMCQEPTFKLYQGQVRFTLTRNDSHVVAVVSCAEPNHVMLTSISPVCDVLTGEWFNLEDVCCHLLHNETWTKVFGWSHYGASSLYGRWSALAEGEMTKCAFRNVTTLQAWDDAALNVGRVKVTASKYDVTGPSVYMTFNGTGRTRDTWFSVDAFLESSYPDLTTEKLRASPTASVSVSGSNLNGIVRRFVVAVNFSQDPIACTFDSGWLVLTRGPYPCNNENSNNKRVYYARESEQRFSEMDYADRFEIWIEVQ